MFKTSITGALLVLTGSLIGTASAQTLKFSVAAEPYPPFSSKDGSGAWRGFEIDLANAVCAAAKLECEIVETPFDALIPALLANKIDVIFASMVITEQRAQTIAFTIPYYNTPPAWVGNKDEKFVLTPDGLSDKIIGVQTATVHLNYLKKNFEPAGAVLKLYQTQDEANSDLANGRIDLTMADSAGEDFFLASDSGQCCEIKGVADKTDPAFGTGIGAGLRKEDSQLLATLNASISTVYANGQFKKLEEKYFSYEIGTPPQQ